MIKNISIERAIVDIESHAKRETKPGLGLEIDYETSIHKITFVIKSV